METYSEARMALLGVDVRFIQDNHSMSAAVGTVRGFHFQAPPHAQAKLVRCVSGRILDVIVDLRRGSPTYGRHVSTELTAEGAEQVFVPIGFGHAFMTLEPNTEVAYKVSALYAPECEGGVRWDDPAIAVAWPQTDATLSDRDLALPGLAALDSPFVHDGEPLGPLVPPAA
jgi:dTDP-4-dehydrorhamnose 3,5-epimerase